MTSITLPGQIALLAKLHIVRRDCIRFFDEHGLDGDPKEFSKLCKAGQKLADEYRAKFGNPAEFWATR